MPLLHLTNQINCWPDYCYGYHHDRDHDRVCCCCDGDYLFIYNVFRNGYDCRLYWFSSLMSFWCYTDSLAINMTLIVLIALPI